TSLSLPGEPTLVDTGEKDWRGDIIYKPIPGEPTHIPCIVESKIYYNESIDAINLPDGHLKVSIPYTEHEQIKRNGEIEVYGEMYQITDVDQTSAIDSTGILTLNVRILGGVKSE